MIRSLNSLRFILILMIMTSHSTLQMPYGLNDYLGEFPVTIFFVISGFVLSLSYGERLRDGEVGNIRFFVSRVSKLYPLHLIILAILVAMEQLLGRQTSWGCVATHAMLLQCWVPARDFVGALNTPTWFMSDIIFFYLTFKHLYGWLTSRPLRRVLPVAGTYMAATVALSLTADGDYSWGYVYYFSLFRLTDFGLGILLYRFYRSDMGKRTATLLLAAHGARLTLLSSVFWLALTAGLYELSIRTNPNLRCAALFWLPAAATVFYVTVVDKSHKLLTRLLHGKALLWLGGISFEMYICHMPIFRITNSMFLRTLGGSSPPACQLCASLLLTTAVAWLAKRVIVTPTYTRISNYLLFSNR